MLHLDQLKTFMVAAELGNFTHAARRLHLSQSAVSQQVRELENQLGCSLFARKARNIALTPAGECLLPLARKLLDDARAAADAVRVAGSGTQGVVRVAASPLAAMALLVPVLGRFTHAHPGIRIQVDVCPADVVADVFRDDAYDAAISEGRPPAIRHPGLVVLRREPIVAVGPSALPQPPGDTAALRLAGVPLIGWPEENVTGALIRKGLSATGLDLEKVCFQTIVADALVQASAAANGLGLAFVPRLAAMSELAVGRLESWDLPGFDVAIDIWALASKDGAANCFLAWLQEHAGMLEASARISAVPSKASRIA